MPVKELHGIYVLQRWGFKNFDFFFKILKMCVLPRSIICSALVTISISPRPNPEFRRPAMWVQVKLKTKKPASVKCNLNIHVLSDICLGRQVKYFTIHFSDFSSQKEK
jgi:hypothetical protein